jgi:DNA-directed RNA polymerase subunit E'/Rpb7
VYETSVAFGARLFQPSEAEVVEQRVTQLIASHLLAQPAGAIAGD